MLLIGGQGALNQHRMGSLQDLPHVDMMKPITKFASSVRHDRARRGHGLDGLPRGDGGAPGPSFLEIGARHPRRARPARERRIPEPGQYRASTKSIGDPADVDRLADILVKAEKPVRAARQPGLDVARRARRRSTSSRTLNIPAYMNGAARGTLPPGDPHHFHLTRRYAFNNADVILIVGTPFDFRMGYGKRLRQEATVVQIDMDYRTVGKNRDVDLGLVGDPGAILAEVTKAAGGRATTAPASASRGSRALREEEDRLKEERLPRLMRDDAPIHPLRLAHEINEFLTENSLYIGDGGDVVTFSGGVVQPKGPGLWMDPGPLGTLGVGVPFAMAAKVARPDREVVCLFGDGAFSLTGWDFETMVRFNLPFVGVVGNNSYMNQIRYGQIQKYGEERGDVGNKLGDVQYDEFAKMLGGYGEEVRDPKDIRPGAASGPASRASRR